MSRMRFLHEDTMGNTIATTSLSGDRLDEYDYTDYGVPLHAPVALDGRWIEDITPHQANMSATPPRPQRPDVSVVKLRSPMLEYNELIGCELRVVKSGPAGAGDVFVTGTVISHLVDEVYIHDPNNAVATAYGASSAQARRAAAFYEMHEGYQKGFIDQHLGTGEWKGGGWQKRDGAGNVIIVNGETVGWSCTYLGINHGSFDTWMKTTKAEFDRNDIQRITFTKPSETPFQTVILDVRPGTAVDPGNGTAHLELVVKDTVPDWADDAGAWYFIDGTERKWHVARSGAWTNVAPPAGPGQTTATYTTSPFASLTEEMVGWTLQPDVNQQVYIPIQSVDPQQHTITVSGAFNGVGGVGARFRIFAPPGVETFGPSSGTLSYWVSAESSRCLYAGYRYESPLAGFYDSFADEVNHRQSGGNFNGLYYTLHRHYDPTLMRFTSPDPAASPFYNLHHYAGNSPARYFDPDGLQLYGDDGLSPAERLRRMEEAQKKKGRPLNKVEAQKAVGPTVPTQAEAVHETLKEVNSKATFGVEEGADENTETGRRVAALSGALPGATDAALVVAGGPVIGIGFRGAGKTVQILRYGDEAVDVARANRIVKFSDDGGHYLTTRTDALGRSKSAIIHVTRSRLGSGTYANRSTRRIVKQLGNDGDDAGHLIGKVLGGPGGVRAGNFIPQLPRVNRGQYAYLEKRLTQRVRGGESVFIRVKPVYRGNSMRPYEIHYRYRVNGRTVRREFQND